MESGIFCFGDLYVARRDSISRYGVVRPDRLGGAIPGEFELQDPSSESPKHRWVPQIVGENVRYMAGEMETHLAEIEDCSSLASNIDDPRQIIRGRVRVGLCAWDRMKDSPLNAGRNTSPSTPSQ